MNRPSFQIVASAAPKHQYTYVASHNCWTGNGCDDIEDGPTEVADPEQCTRQCDTEEECDCAVYHFPDHQCWRRKNCDQSKLVEMTGYRVYIKEAATVTGRITSVGRLAKDSWSGFWLDPASTDSRKVPFSARAGDVVQQPPSFPHDAILRVIF